MKYLITNNRLKVGEEIFFNKFLQIKNDLKPNYLINNELVESEIVKTEVSIDGNIDMHADYGYTIENDIYDFVYLVDIKEDKVIIKDVLSNGEYINLVIDLLNTDVLDVFYSKNSILLDAIEKSLINEECFNKIKDKIYEYISSNNCKEENLIDLIRVLEEKILDGVKGKLDFMKSIYSAINKKDLPIAVQSRCDYDYVKNSMKKYNIELNLNHCSLFSIDDDLDDLPFI